MSTVGWEVDGELTFEEWRDAGERLGQIGRSSRWWIGDWINYGSATYGEKYDQALAVTGYDVGSLMDMAWLANTFEISRRRENLSWSHHAEIAALGEDDQERWLDRAVAGSWSVKKLRSAVKSAQAIGGGAGDGVGGIARTPGPSAPSSTPAVPAAAVADSTADETLLLELRHRGSPAEINAALEQLAARAADLGFEVLELPIAA